MYAIFNGTHAIIHLNNIQGVSGPDFVKTYTLVNNCLFYLLRRMQNMFGNQNANTNENCQEILSFQSVYDTIDEALNLSPCKSKNFED